MPLALLLSFNILTCPSLRDLQEVSAPCSVAFLPHPDLSLPMPPPGSECFFLSYFLSALTCPFIWISGE